MKRAKWMGLAALALLAACAETAGDPANAAPPKPALWKLADKDTTIYLFGTIHVLPRDFAWRTPKIDKAIKASNGLVLEVADGDDPQKSAMTFMKLGVSPDLPPVEERVPEAKRAGLHKLILKSGITPDALRNFESWAVAVTLSAGMLRDLDVSPDYGVERLLTNDFKKAGKPVDGLETTAQQLGFFDGLPEAAQRSFLASMVDESIDPKAEFAKMTGAWASGDTNAIAVTFDDELKLSPELTETLLRNRNRNWTGWLAKRLDTPGTVFVAVGAGHLAGPDSVQTMLAAKGYKVSRIQ